VTTALTYEKENEMFFLFLPCPAKDLGLFLNFSRMFQGTKGTSGEHPGCSLFSHCDAKNLRRPEQKAQAIHPARLKQSAAGSQRFPEGISVKACKTPWEVT